MIPRVAIDPRAAAAYGISGELPLGAIIVTAGHVLKVLEDGSLDDLRPGGHPRCGIAGEPCATRRA